MYTIEDKKMLSYKQQPLKNQAWTNNANSTAEEILVGARTATLVTSKVTGYYTLYWSDGAYNYTLQSFSDNITPAQMVQIAASVK